MKQTVGSFQTSDGLKLHTESWLPEGDPKAVILISHGLAEHIGRYNHVAEYFVERGYAVYGPDHRGHGQSEGNRAYFESFDQPVNDLKLYLDQVKAAQPGKKVFLYGHSQGSLIGLVFVLRYQSDLAGYVCSGAPLAVESSQSPLLVRLANLLNRFVPRYELPSLPPQFLSHDPAIVTAYTTDPLNYHGGVHVHTGYSIVHTSRNVKQRAGDIKLPLFIIHGEADQICPSAGSRILYERAGSADKQFKFYPGLYHEIHNELEKETVLTDIVTWLDQRA